MAKPDLTVVAAVERDLKQLEDDDLARSGLAASALALARELDAEGNSATSRAMCAKALLDTLDRLWELAPEKQEGDRLDDLATRRAARRAATA